MRSPEKPIVLFVDDDETDLLLLERIAKKLDFREQVTTVADPDEALDFLNGLPSKFGTPPVVLVTDINMPNMSGHELIGKVRASDRLCNLPIFVLTTSDLQSDFERAYRAKVAGYVVKDTAGKRVEVCVAMLKSYCDAIGYPPGT